MRKLNVVMAVVISCALSMTAIAQSKTPIKKKTTTKSVERAPKEDVPPPVEKLEDTRIDTSGGPELSEDIIPAELQPKINFDTTAAPNDTFTEDIMQLLIVTGALDTDIKAAEQALKQSMGNKTDTLSNEYYQRFMYEMREGRARRWLTNLYVRTYRQHFTQTEARELLQFYKTPLGKKLIEAMPLFTLSVMADARKIGAYLGQTIMIEVMQNENK